MFANVFEAVDAPREGNFAIPVEEGWEHHHEATVVCLMVPRAVMDHDHCELLRTATLGYSTPLRVVGLGTTLLVYEFLRLVFWECVGKCFMNITSVLMFGMPV